MIKINFVADDDYAVRDVDVSEGSTNVEKAMLLAQMRIVETQLLDIMNDEWSVEE